MGISNICNVWDHARGERRKVGQGLYMFELRTDHLVLFARLCGTRNRRKRQVEINTSTVHQRINASSLLPLAPLMLPLAAIALPFMLPLMSPLSPASHHHFNALSYIPGPISTESPHALAIRLDNSREHASSPRSARCWHNA
jgi:hypothetical protein